MDNLTVVIPFWNGHDVLPRLLGSLPDWLPVVIVDDQSDEPLQLERDNTKVLRPAKRGYFAGAVNAGADVCDTDFLVLNQDAELRGNAWLDLIAKNKGRYATFGEGVMRHPAWPDGYVQGTFMYIDRKAWNAVGKLNEERYPLWGCTCEWQLRACRMGYKALPLGDIPGLIHADDRKPFYDADGIPRRQRFGQSIMEAMRRERHNFHWFTRTPPMVSVIMPCYNYGHYLEDAINSFLGGETSLGRVEKQTLDSFEIIIIDDASTDDSWRIALSFHDRWRGIRAMRLPENLGTPGALNHAIKRAYGEFIHVCSADDMRFPDTLETLLNVCQKNPHSNVAYGDVVTFKNGEIKQHLPLPDYDFERLLTKNPMSAGIMYPKQAWREVGGYPEEMQGGREDWAFNIALGASGWCGVHVGKGKATCLYRREGQNRSLETSNIHKGEIAPDGSGRHWGRFFRQQLRELYPSLYRGERPMGCCGGGASRNTSRSSRSSRRKRQPLPGQAGMVILEYIGASDGEQSFWGPVTSTQYRFGGSRKQGYVDSKDAKGMLEIFSKRRKPLFREVKPKPKPKPQPESEPEVQESVPEVQAPTELVDLPGVGKRLVENLAEKGYYSLIDVFYATPEDLEQVKGVSKTKALALLEAVKDVIGG